ncbi:MAG: DUF2442 domain-containing protein [Planctomycetia bacterium]|nr:DUF2442 domain-containing protein [Planctomycetia bacterium]
MRSMVRVRSAVPLSGFVVRVTFTDASQRDINLEPFLRGPVFEPIRASRETFCALRVDERMGTIVWPNGADIDPDVLFLNLRPAWMESPVNSPAVTTARTAPPD